MYNILKFTKLLLKVYRDIAQEDDARRFQTTSKLAQVLLASKMRSPRRFEKLMAVVSFIEEQLVCAWWLLILWEKHM